MARKEGKKRRKKSRRMLSSLDDLFVGVRPRSFSTCDPHRYRDRRFWDFSSHPFDGSSILSSVILRVEKYSSLPPWCLCFFTSLGLSLFLLLMPRHFSLAVFPLSLSVPSGVFMRVSLFFSTLFLLTLFVLSSYLISREVEVLSRHSTRLRRDLLSTEDDSFSLGRGHAALRQESESFLDQPRHPRSFLSPCLLISPANALKVICSPYNLAFLRPPLLWRIYTLSSRKMSLRTPALPSDFTYFSAWYGKIPSFAEYGDSSFRPSCSDAWFSWRVANLNSLYLPRLHHAGKRRSPPLSIHHLLLSLLLRPFLLVLVRLVLFSVSSLSRSLSLLSSLALALAYRHTPRSLSFRHSSASLRPVERSFLRLEW